ncbi:meiosis-specific protein ASY3 isoform X2 [Cryptomeria japonica]|uniref:meiosis-specific protein ASY3 isoform X2 n=1 Tax=Cryptomeria japonica TaxID=3369 RepID=UPI0027D9E468|nr:meiosis-specific protein ASY3 isoform X2 [Cryptomeria japonica]
MEVDRKHKFKREEKQPWTWKSKEVAGKENSSFTTDSRSRKASIGITVAFSKRNLNVYEVPPLKPETEAYSSVRGRKTWTPLTPLKPQMMAPATNQRQQDDIICPNPQELQLQSTQIVEEVYANRKSPLHSTGFAARRETNFVKYERRGKKENLVGELCIERSHHVKFNFNPSSPSQEKNTTDDKSSEIALRKKLRNALGSLKSLSPEKQQPQAAAPQNEPKSDTIETEWEEAQQIAKPVKSRVQQRGKRKPSPPLHEHIFSFDQDEVECERKPTKLSRMFTKTHPNTNAGLKLLLQTSPEKIIQQSSTDTEIQNHRSPSPAATAIRSPAEIKTHPDTNEGLKPPLQTSPKKIIQESSTDTEIQNHRSPSPAATAIRSPAEMPATTTFAESPSACLLARLRQRKGHMLVSDEKARVEPHKEASPLFIARDVISRSSARAYRNRVIETETKICRRRQVKRKSREQSPHKECAPHDEDGSDDSSDLMGVVKHFAGILQKFKKKLKMEVDRNKTQILNSASHDIYTEVDRIRSQIQSEIAKYTNLCKAKHRQWEAHLQDEKEKLELIHEKFNKDLAQLTQSWQTIFSQIEGEEIELKSIAERQKVSHRKLVSQMQETIESQLAYAEAKIAAVRKAAGNNMQALKRVMGQTF